MASVRIEIGQLLGAGTFGKVYAGTFRGKDVAIKKIPLEQLDDDVGDLIDFDHPNVLKVFHREDRDEFRYLILELCAGTLDDFIGEKYRGPMPSDEEAVGQMAAGLQHIHANDVVHRDVKPSNVLVFKSAAVSVLKISDPRPRWRQTDGRPSAIRKRHNSFTAPELIESLGNEEKLRSMASDRSDIFALGCTFFVFLTRGTHPFGYGLNVSSRIRSGTSDLSKLPGHHLAVELIARMIRSSADERPSATEVCSLLGTWPLKVLQPFVSPKWPSISSLKSLRHNDDHVFTLLPENKLGKGNFAVVFKEMYDDHPVAVKRIELERCKNDERSREEQSIMKQLDHRNVLHLINYIDRGEFRFLVLELCDGTLDDFIRAKLAHLNIQSNELDWLLQMAAGVQHIHSIRLVHRDIKPQNVLISVGPGASVVLKISDFGFSKPVTDTGSFSQGSGVKGTFDYMAPEMLTSSPGERRSIASDIFSLGCVFFNLVVRGRHPFGDTFFIVPNIVTGNAVNIALADDFRASHLIREMIAATPSIRPSIDQVVLRLNRLTSTN